ncbi:MAG: peptidylprolyl isomerase [Chloroflexi bacterium]|nr:peptidylprolyl isomerase [Chloroflexota bacterium]
MAALPSLKRLAVAPLIAFLLVITTGCKAPLPAGSPTASTSPSSSTQTTAPLPTATGTQEPLAARVNGEGITLAEFNADLARFQEAQKSQGTSLTAEDQKKQVLSDLVDRVLLAQAAVKNGFTLDDAALQARADSLAAQIGGAQALKAWETAHGYDDASFQLALRREAAAAWERDQIVAEVPTTAEQVHARQILVNTADEAQNVLDKIKSGVDFATLALRYDPVTGGDLGWFPRGYLTEPDVEAAAFNLQPGETSQAIQGKLGYHVIEVIARDANRPLSPDALRTLQGQALQKWIQDARSNNQIELFTP